MNNELIEAESLLKSQGETWESILQKTDEWKEFIYKWAQRCPEKFRKLYLDRVFLSGWGSNQSMYDYREKIPRTKRIELPDIITDRKEWFPCNPSICPNYTNDGYFIIQRAVNFSSHRATNYVSHSSDGKFSTRNLLLLTDLEFKVKGYVEILDQSNRKLYPKHVQGLEDMQIFQIKEGNKKQKHKRLGFFCTLVDCLPTGNPQMGFGLISIATGKITNPIRILGNGPDICEKNWLPWWENKGISILYSGSNMKKLRFDPHKLSPDSTNVPVTLLTIGGYRTELRDVRGGGGPINFLNNFLFLFHEVIWINNGRTYIHRFAMVDKLRLEVLKVSTFFTFENIDIEFARSMIWNLDQSKILIGVGIEDHQSFIYEIDPKVIENLLVF